MKAAGVVHLYRGEIMNATSAPLRTSKAGKPRHVLLADEGRPFLAALTAGKLGDASIFRRAAGGVWGKSHELRRMREACRHAKIKPEASFHVLRHTHGSALAMRGAMASLPSSWAMPIHG